MKISTLFFLMLSVAACTQEAVYRGVPAQSWTQLSSEQKQLIVDQSFHTEVQQKV
jgi:hypothetical protein